MADDHGCVRLMKGPGAQSGILRSMPLRFTGERIIPELPELRVTYLQSLAAYVHAVTLSPSIERALDCGCGEGYGSAYLAQHARAVVGLDRDQESVAWAGQKYASHVNLSFAVADAAALPLAGERFDLICCFQVFEHLPQPERFLAEARRLLTPGGMLVLTTPNGLLRKDGLNPHHVDEYSPDELRRRLGSVFERVDLSGLFGSERVASYRSSNDQALRSILRWDILGLHRMIPQSIHGPLHAGGTRLLRSWLHRRRPDLTDSITVDDFSFRQENLEQSIDLLAICRV